MDKLATTFLGLNLRNPIIAGSSGITSDIEKMKQLDKSGVGAIILKSVFEEQILMEVSKNQSEQMYTEEYDYLMNYTLSEDVQRYLDLIKTTKRSLSVPVIASISCVDTGNWVDFARYIAEAGADALELNMVVLPMDEFRVSEEIERTYYRTIQKIKEDVAIPLLVKISPYFTNLLLFVDNLQACGAKGLTLFNRFYEADIDIKGERLVPGAIYSSPSDLKTTLRWTGIVSSKGRHVEVSSSTGVHSSEAVIKLLLAGARTVQVCSAIYEKGVEVIPKMLGELNAWMDQKMYKSVDEFRGKLSYASVEDGFKYERIQFMKYFDRVDGEMKR